MGSSEVYASHSTWSDYYSMIRVFKDYTFSFKSTGSVHVFFSSYPGATCSIDDFYQLDSGLVVMETTNDIYNLSLYEEVVPQSLLTSYRVLLANMLSTTGSDWTDTFALHNSGTYNNQWIVVDYYKVSTAAEQLEQGTVWVLEQIPGEVEAADMTAFVNNNSYWGRYYMTAFVNMNTPLERLPL